MTATTTGWTVKLEGGPSFIFDGEAVAVEAWQVAEYQLGHVATIHRSIRLGDGLSWDDQQSGQRHD